jgi:hypothetical protein
MVVSTRILVPDLLGFVVPDLHGVLVQEDPGMLIHACILLGFRV